MESMFLVQFENAQPLQLRSSPQKEGERLIPPLARLFDAKQLLDRERPEIGLFGSYALLVRDDQIAMPPRVGQPGVKR